MSAYYVLGYKATYPTNDSKTRRLRIKVNRPDAFVYPDDRPMMPPPRTETAEDDARDAACCTR